MGTSGGAKPITNGGDGVRVVPETLDALKLLPLWEHPLGEVFSSGDGKSERALQLTVLRPELVRGEQALRRCIDTNAMLAEMESPYIPALLDARRVMDGRVVLATARLEGMPLGQHMLDGPMSPGRVIAILRQLCRALDVAHALGVRHGALSVASVILVEHAGRADAVRLVDFGLEDELTVEAMTAQEVERQPLSPEKLGGHAFDQREDVYLLGAVGYAALAGRPLFTGDAAAVRSAHERSTPDALDCDAPLAAVILRCLNKDPSKRFPDVRSIDDALLGAQELSGFTTGWDDLRPMGGANTSGSQGKPKTLGLGSIGRIPPGPYGVVGADKAKTPMTTAEKLAEKLKAGKEAKPEGKAAMTPAEKLAEKLKAQRRADAEARLEAEKKVAADKEPEPEKKLELKKIDPEKQLEAPRNLSPSASATFDATELIEDVAGESGAFAAPPPPPTKGESSGRQPAVTPVPSPAKTSPIAPPPATKAKGSGSSGSSFDRAATLSSGSSGSSFDRTAAVGSSTSGSFDRAATLGFNLGRAGAGAGKTPTPAPVPPVIGKPTPVPKVDSKPIPVAVAKVDSKPTPAAKPPIPVPVPVPVAKADSKPTPAAKPEPDAAESMTLEAIAEEPTKTEAKTEVDAPQQPVASDVITAPKLSSEPSEAVTKPRAVPVVEQGEDEVTNKKTPVWLIAAGVALLIGLPAAWLATRDDSTPTTAAADSKPKPPEATPDPATKGQPTPQPEPTPPQPEPAPVDTGVAASGGAPVAEPDDGGQPAADGGTVPPPEPVADPEPDTPSSDGGGATPASAPSPAEKARELVRAGDKAYAAGQLGKAESKYKAALAENQRSHAAAAGLGRIAFNKASYGDAATYYGRAVKASGSNGEYRIHYGDALFKLGKYADAKVQYTKAKSLGNAQADGRLKKVQAKLGS